MDQTGAVGLDLSFASWVFLLEPIEDASLYQQVVSRAHRMGAKQPVHLETLVMKVNLLYPLWSYCEPVVAPLLMSIRHVSKLPWC